MHIEPGFLSDAKIMAANVAAVGQTRAERDHGRPESVWRLGRLHASFLHLYFPSNPSAIAALFDPATPPPGG